MVKYLVIENEYFASMKLIKLVSAVRSDYKPAFCVESVEDAVELHGFLDEIEKKLEYQIWFHGHYHEDHVVWTPDQRPVVSLFDRVVELDQIKTDLQ